MGPKKPRGLKLEEAKLWARVTETATPLAGGVRLRKPKTNSADQNPDRSIAQQGDSEAKKSALAAKAFAIKPPALSVSDHKKRSETAPVLMDKKAYSRLQRGKLSPEAKLDLHGFTLDQAHQELNRFVLNAHSRGKRLVLVITGKGKSQQDLGPIPTRMGVLRHQVPHWLQTQPLKPLIMQITQASPKHGGSGAYYVYLRRARS